MHLGHDGRRESTHYGFETLQFQENERVFLTEIRRAEKHDQRRETCKSRNSSISFFFKMNDGSIFLILIY